MKLGAVGDRTLNSVEYRRVEIVVCEALRKLAKCGVPANRPRPESRAFPDFVI
jgi:hypothetical protein